MSELDLHLLCFNSDLFTTIVFKACRLETEHLKKS